MSDKRPCSACRRWFTKDPRVRTRQHVCGRPECVAARNKRACASWRKANPDQVIASRLRWKLPKSPPDPPEVVVLDPIRHFTPAVVRHVMGVKAAVVLGELAKVLLYVARHEMPPVAKVRPCRTPKVLASVMRHETASPPAPP